MISVIIPLYNKESVIEKTIESVLCQSYTDFEVVIVDDGSTDRSCDVIGDFSDDRLTLYHKTNGGVSSARNAGIEKANGEWLYFLDADDVIERDALTTLCLCHSRYPDASVCSTNYHLCKKGKVSDAFVGGKDGYMEDPFKQMWQKKWGLRMGSFIVKRTRCNAIRFCTSIDIGEDLLFVMDIINDGHLCAYINRAVMDYNMDNSQLSHRNATLDEVLESHLDLYPDNKYLRYINRELVIKRIIKSFLFKDVVGKQLLYDNVMLIPGFFLVVIYRVYTKICNSI